MTAGFAVWQTVGASASGPSDSPAWQRAVTPVTGATLVTLARAQAAAAGDAAPTLIQHVLTTRQRANLAAGGDKVPGDNPSYLVAIRGNYTVQRALPPIPPGAPAPTQTTANYSVITLVVDASTGQITDYGISDEYPNLDSVGAVSTDSSN